MYTPPMFMLYKHIAIYMSWGPGFTPPPPKGRVPQDGLPQRVEYACHACICMHMHSFAWIYAFAYPHLHMHALRMHASIYVHGMH